MTDRTSKLVFEWELFRHDPRRWLFLTGNRILVSLLLLLLVAAVITAVMASGLVPLREETPVLFLLFALIGANFTLIAIVTSLSQFVLSRQLESPDEIRETLYETVSYREDVGETTGHEVMPVKPDAFFLTLYVNANEELEALAPATAAGRTKRAREELADLVTGLQAHAEYVIDLLERPSSGMKHALFTSVTTEYENYVHRTWYLRTEHGDEFTELVAGPLGRLTETLEHIVVASRLFKTVFIESEVGELSRLLLYVGIPVQLTAVLVMLLYTAPDSTPVPPPAVMAVLVSLILTAGFAPFLILTSYVVRLTVVARRTADIFPFSSRLEGTIAVRDGGPARES